MTTEPKMTQTEANERLISLGYCNDEKRNEMLVAMAELGLVAEEPQNPRVTQADREAAAGQYIFVQSRLKAPHSEELQQRTFQEIRAGRWDKDESVQAFARHREASTATLTAQVEALTACAKASMEMAEDYHAAHIAERDRAQAAEAKVEALTAANEALREALADPNAVHANLLRGSIARPSVSQIIHVYGREAILTELMLRGDEAARAALASTSDGGEA